MVSFPFFWSKERKKNGGFCDLVPTIIRPFAFFLKQLQFGVSVVFFVSVSHFCFVFFFLLADGRLRFGGGRFCGKMRTAGAIFGASANQRWEEEEKENLKVSMSRSIGKE